MDKIIDSIYSGIVKGYKKSFDISILTGSSGKILFLAYLYNSTRNEQVKQDLECLIEHTIELIINQHPDQLDFSYGRGVTGFYWVINHLYRNKILFKDSVMLKDILTKEIDNRIVESLRIDFSLSKYDPLYGYIGKGLYFLAKPESKFTTGIIGEILATLTRDRVRIDNESITWIDVRLKYEQHEPNNERLVLSDCGQAHGVTGIISFLCTVLEKFESKEIKAQAESLLRPAVNWLLSQEIPKEWRGVFMFPPAVNLLQDDRARLKKMGRLGWCYGDNVIAYALYRASAILNEERYCKKADEITLNCCQVSIEQSGVLDLNHKKIFDPSLCHGSAGIAHLYQQIYHYNKSPLVLEAISSWKELTATYTRTYLESGQLRSLTEVQEEAFDFLYGYSGIGLHLISDFYSNHGWESCMMID